MAGTSFGIGSPLTNPFSQQVSPWGPGIQGQGTTPFGVPQFGGQPQTNLPFSTVQPFQQIVQLLQVLPQQLQNLQQLAFVQQQHLQQLQQLVQVIPAQLAQLQQLIQYVPQQIQQMQQPYGQAFGAGLLGASPLGISPQTFGSQPGYLM